MNSNQIRETFLNFFRSKGHIIVSSAPMVVKGDPTLMFTNAGMNQFKDLFLGNSPVRDHRVADTQKCLRVSGKHNDLDEVGHDTYHHTMFEMLGNWSFGDYFKREAIAWAWELLHDVYKMPADRMYATVFEGSADDNLPCDTEALNFWKQYLPESHILLGNKKDNFWEMGDTGPCGPCSEIHFDLRSDEERKKIDGATLVNTSDPLVIEIWNLVFMQFNRKANGSLEPLPNKHVDTGMGFERLCMILQGKQSNYDTDVFQPTIRSLAQMCGKNYGDDQKADIAMRVIADHLRAIAFSIADGQLPSNVKAGYVIRRILRRAVRYGYTYLGFSEPFICKLVPVLAAQMGGQFPELRAQQSLIEKVIEEEEASFLRTLATGINLLDGVIKKSTGGVISGSDAFLLYDTYGFPIDLTELIARENGMKVDLEGFEKELAEQKERSRNAAAVETDDWVDVYPSEVLEFVGYDTLEAEVRIVRYRKVTSKSGVHYQIVLDQTPFYGNSGGQVGDTGYLETDGQRIEVTDTQKENNLIVHIVSKLPSDVSAIFTARVNAEKRIASASNHTATHLMHHALRKVLGEHVEQKGSLVTPDYLRFDASHFQKITPEELRQVERLVNAEIRRNHTLNEIRNCPIKKAQDMGAMMLFGEKYGDSVRVIGFGDSTELCGGTHVAATGQIGFFRIISESSVSAGVRRIEAITAARAEEYCYVQENMLLEIKSFFATPHTVQAIQKLAADNEVLNKQLEELQKQRIKLVAEELAREADTTVKGMALIIDRRDIPSDVIKDMAYTLKANVENLAFVCGSIYGDKPTLTVMLADSLVERGLDAGAIVREAAKEINGGGGGQKTFATAGGKDASKIADAIRKAESIIRAKMQ